MEEKELAQEHFSRLGLAFLIGSLAVNAAKFLVSLLVNLWKPGLLENTSINVVVSSLTMYLIGMPILYLIVRKVPRVEVPRKKMKAGHFLLALLMSYPIMYCSNWIGVILTAIIGLIKGSPVNNEILTIVSDTNIGVIVLYMVIAAPIMEELIFRKLIVDRTVRYGQGVAVVVSGVMFGLFHGNLNQFVYATALGMFFAFLYAKTGNIKITIALHMFINFMGGLVSMLLLKAIHYEELMELMNAGGRTEELMAFYMMYLPGWLLYGMYAVLVVTLVITGIILLIVFRKRFVLEKGEVVIPKGECFDTVFINIGMLAFCLFWTGMIIVQLFLG